MSVDVQVSSTNDVFRIIDALRDAKPKDVDAFATLFGVSFGEELSVAGWSHVDAVALPPAIESARVSLSPVRKLVRVAVQFDPGKTPIIEAAALVQRFGHPSDVRVTPNVPPEGLSTSRFDLDATVTIGVTARTRHLLSIALEWQGAR